MGYSSYLVHVGLFTHRLSSAITGFLDESSLLMDHDLYQIRCEPPKPEDYCRLRENAGLSGKSIEAATRAMPKSVFAVSVYEGQTLIGMGRVVGDDCHLQIVDMAVHPSMQRRGIGRLIMQRLCDLMAQNVDPKAFISMIADGDSHHLYSKFGFQPVEPYSIGMWRRFP